METEKNEKLTISINYDNSGFPITVMRGNMYVHLTLDDIKKLRDVIGWVIPREW